MTGISSRVRTLYSFLLCLMVLLFAIQAKTAWYKVPSPTVRTLVASKFWKDGQTQNISIPDQPKDSVSAFIVVFAILSLPLLRRREWLQKLYAPAVSFFDLEGIHQFHRPPPSTL